MTTVTATTMTSFKSGFPTTHVNYGSTALPTNKVIYGSSVAVSNSANTTSSTTSSSWTIPQWMITPPTTSNQSLYSTVWNSNVSNGVSGTLEAENDIILAGKSMKKLLESIEDRLAVIIDADPEKLEKFSMLKKAYEHYKMIEKLIGDE